ncbi:hypothetical protein OESDEN_23782 [Oesophagostomum dentatum]|uniref:Uncharacterized protein n=1 Tax=Oesophagostomum dentatum TaxID=61180 RepID=A0A0B1RU28_OESDE|nr:hypothetical protein OESDEN_23782 [Oesophagostomum dentatum]
MASDFMTSCGVKWIRIMEKTPRTSFVRVYATTRQASYETKETKRSGECIIAFTNSGLRKSLVSAS